MLFVVALLLAGCGGSSASKGGEGTLFGKVSGGPGGACPSQAPCSIPASGLNLSFLREGGDGPAVGATTDAKGRYRVRLPAGRYTVEGSQLLKPRQVEVSAGDSRRVNFSVDTKIS
jgi:hypothetical protein